MPETTCIRELREHLCRHGLPRQRLERILREVAEHWEDACASAREQGLEAEAAEAQAADAIGNPARLADSFATQLRRHTWLGRNRCLALALLPPLLLLAVFAVMALPIWGIGELLDRSNLDFWKKPPYPQVGVAMVWTLYCAGTAIVPLMLTWWAWQAGLGRRFVWLVWASCLFGAAFRFFDASAVKHHVILGLRFPPRFDAHSIVMLLVHFAVAGMVFTLMRPSHQTGVGSSQTHEN